MSLLDRLLRRRPLPEGVVLEPEEHVLATAEVVDGGQVVATSRGLWLPGTAGSLAGPATGTAGSLAGPAIGTAGSLAGPAVGAERLSWHLISKATWEGGVLGVVATRETENLAGAVLIADQPVRRFRLATPGRVPEIVHRRVTGSIRSRHHRDLPGGGAWFVQRAVPGRDGTVLQVRADPGTDVDAVRRVASEVAQALRLDA